MSLFEPAPLWEWVAQRKQRIVPGLVALAVLCGLVVATATEIGVRVFNSGWNQVAGYTAQANRGWSPFFALWLLAAALPLVQGLFGAWLLPMYGRPRDWTGGLAVGVIGSLPIYTAAPALVLLPGILLVCIAFLISCAWWGSGARLLLGVPFGEAADHVAASIIVSSVVLSVASAVVPFG